MAKADSAASMCLIKEEDALDIRPLTEQIEIETANRGTIVPLGTQQILVARAPLQALVVKKGELSANLMAIHRHHHS